MKCLIHWKYRLRSFLKAEEGSAMLLVGMATGVLLLSAGIAIDMGRVQTVQTRLSNAVDAAGLAAGATLSSADPTTVALKYFYANYPKSPETYLGASIQDPSVIVSEDNMVLTLDVQGTVPTTFMQYFGITNVPVQAHTQITRTSMGMELALVMDTTGSMSGSAGGGLTKLQAAKNAAAILLDILYGSKPTVNNLWIGLVPFSQAVNIGTNHDSWTTNPAGAPATLNWGPNPSAWQGCVEARAAGGMDVTDDNPVLVPFPKYHSPCNHDTGTGDSATNAWYGTNSSKNNCQTVVSPATWPLYLPTPTPGAVQFKTLNNSSQGPNLNCPMPITPLVAEKATVLAAVNAMEARGSTEIPLGLAWGWRLLSPKWQNIWGGQMDINGLPLAYNTPLMTKVVILMTDGDNDISWDTYTAYGFPNNGFNYTSGNQLGANACTSSSNCTNGETQLNTRTAQICTSMKAQGILIYTIALGTSINSTSQNMLKNCATKPEYYFLSPDATSLTAAFKTIGDSLANLHVSQ